MNNSNNAPVIDKNAMVKSTLQHKNGDIDTFVETKHLADYNNYIRTGWYGYTLLNVVLATTQESIEANSYAETMYKATAPQQGSNYRGD